MMLQILTERVHVRTARGPGGMAGPLRLDTHYINQPNCHYSQQEAVLAFERMQVGHTHLNCCTM